MKTLSLYKECRNEDNKLRLSLSPFSAAVKPIITRMNTLLGATTRHKDSPHSISQQLDCGIYTPGRGGARLVSSGH